MKNRKLPKVDEDKLFKTSIGYHNIPNWLLYILFIFIFLFILAYLFV